MNAQLVSEAVAALHAARRYCRQHRDPTGDQISARCSLVANKLQTELSRIVISLEGAPNAIHTQD